MRGAEAFLVPMTRPAVIVLLLFTIATTGILLVAVADDDFPTRAVDIGVLAMLGFAGGAGFLAGAALRELQHCRFTWVLPAVRGKTLAGYLATAIVIAALVSFFVRLHRPDLFWIALFAVGLAAYCLGSVLVDRRSHLRTALHSMVALLLVTWSQRLGELCASRPEWVAPAAAVVVALALQRSFGVGAFRELPFVALAPLPGAFSLSQSARYERDKLARRGTSRTGSTSALPTGSDLRSWARRAFHENVKGSALRTMLLESRAMLTLFVIVLAHAFAERHNGGFGGALARTLFHVTLQPPLGTPGVPPAEADMPHLILPLYFAGVGGAVTYLRSAPLGARLLYPLSRANRARVVFRTCLRENVGFLATIGGGMTAVAVVSGLYLGYPVLPGYLPQVVRAAAVTGAMLPVMQWFRLRTTQAGPKRAPYAMVGLIFGLIAMAAVSGVWCSVSPWLFRSALLELVVLALLFAWPQVRFRRALDRHFRTRDLG